MTDISVTRIKSFKQCLREYELRYVHGLQSLKPPTALVVGKSYHQKIDDLIKTGSFEDTGAKTDAMANAFKEFIYPKFNFKCSEQEFSVPLDDTHNLIGRIDAFLEDGTPVEHKTTGSKPDEIYQGKLAWDDQVAAYMIATGTNKMLYTVCQKPTIRQKKTETEQEYLERCKEWYTPDKIKAFYVYRSPEELQAKLEEFKAIANEMDNRDLFYRNPDHCKIIGCPFEDICLDYDPELEEVPLGYEKRY